MCIERLHVDRSIPSGAHDLRQALGIVLVGFVEPHLQCGLYPPGIKTRDIEAGGAQPMDKPGYHRTGLNPNFCISTGMSEHLCRDRIGVRGAHAPPEPTPLLVHDADRRRLLRYIQSDIVRHPNLRRCKPPDDNRPDRGTIDGSRPFRDYPRSTPAGGQSCYAATDVRGYSIADRPATNAACAGMT